MDPRNETLTDKMTLNEYQKLALRTAPLGVTQDHDLQHALLGLISEVGELADALKKAHAYGKPIDRVNLREELGDVLWYLPLACRALGCDLGDIAQLNIAKLAKRYPEKFTAEAALNRDLAGERAVLESEAKASLVGQTTMASFENGIPVVR